MPISEWWASDPNERFWMEITDRSDLGGGLRAPMVGTDGQAIWHYELVSHTKPGDIVFHWHRGGGRPGIVGWSKVVGPLQETQDVWIPHAGSGAINGPDVLQPNWLMPLGGLHLLDRPITGDEIVGVRGEVLNLFEEMRDVIDGPGYFPFASYGKDGIRAAQAYLTKFPVGLVAVIQSISTLELDSATDGGAIDALGPAKSPSSSSSQGYLRDTELRIAIERYAVERAIAHYSAAGAERIEVLGKPFDLRVLIAGKELHVEVKGSSSTADAVFVTVNEVTHARTYEYVDLFVVDEIRISRESGAQAMLSHGRTRLWNSWDPTDETLSPLQYRHELQVGPSVSQVDAVRIIGGLNQAEPSTDSSQPSQSSSTDVS